MSDRTPFHLGIDDSALGRREKLCEQFDRQLRQGGSPQPEEYLAQLPPPERASLLKELFLLELAYRGAAGADEVRRTYLDRFPDHRSVVEDAFSQASSNLAATLACEPRDGSHSEDRTHPTVTPTTPSLEPRLPNYEILSTLGRGGMGVVYKARHKPLDRLVALKMLPSVNVFEPRSLYRFRIEAEAIARLQHPHIVQIFEVGEMDDTPYLALELVEGGSLDALLDGNPWEANRVVGLLEALAETIDYAHQRQIVHRDLKPANILVEHSSTDSLDGILRFKVTDFGLAKQLDSDTRATHEGDVLGTPSYMATEQVLGKISEIGPRTDVYALGAIAYELLTGKPPFGCDTVIETIQQVRDTEPVPPRKLNPKCPRDVETIVLKCLEKDPARRYASAAELAQDLRHFREHRPILARPAGTWETVLKWARRNPSRAALVSLATVALVVIVVGVFVHLQRIRVERAKAERNAELAVRAVNEMLTEVAVEQLAYEPRMEQKRRALLDKARVLYETMLQDRPDDPEVRRQLAIGFRHLGDMSRQLGDLDAAEQYYHQAIERLSELLQESPDGEILRHLSDAHNFLGEVKRLSGRPEQAVESYSEAVKLQERQVVEQPNDPTPRLHLGRSHDNLALAYLATQKFDRAESESTTAIALLRGLCKSDAKPVHRQHLARARLNQGVIFRQSNQLDEAEKAVREAVSLLSELSAEDTLKPDYRHELASAWVNLGNLLGASPDRREEAEEAQRHSANLFRELTRQHPDIPIYRTELANTLNGLAVTQIRGSRSDEALKSWVEAVGLLRQLARESPEVEEYRSRLGVTLGNVARLHLLRKDFAKAREMFEEAIRLVTPVLEQNPNEPDYLNAWKFDHLGLADALIALNEDQAAIEIARRLPNAIPDPEKGRHVALCFLARCVQVRESLAEPEDRERVLRPFLSLARVLYEQVQRDEQAETQLKADPAFAPLIEKL